jgi:hypothetical protein
MKIVIAGGTGFIGRPLCETLLREDHQVTVLARFHHEARYILPPTATIVGWDGLTRGPWERALEGADAVINLAGEPVADARWTADRKQVLRDSRINSTRLLVQAIWNLPHRPATLINASAIGYYGPRDAVPVNEQTLPGRGFLADLCVDWEREAMKADAFGLRVVRLRTGMVLGDDGGALPRMVPPFRFFLGGPIMPGDQWVSWIHRQDLIRMVHWALADSAVRGPLNGVASDAVTMRDFCGTLGRVINRPSWLPVPEFALRLGLGELASLLTTGQRVEPAAALRGGFTFRHTRLEHAIEEILGDPSKARQISNGPIASRHGFGQ